MDLSNFEQEEQCHNRLVIVEKSVMMRYDPSLFVWN